MEPRIVELGDAALTLEFGDRIDRELHARVMATQAALPALAGITDVVPTYRSLTVHFDPLELPHARLAAELRAAAEKPMEKSVLAGRRWEIPVCFGGDFGPDLAAVATATGRSEQDIIDTLCSMTVNNPRQGKVEITVKNGHVDLVEYPIIRQRLEPAIA